ncbi:MAG TPA: 1,4-dihydroxy-2-naphthoate polyprenyltransferase [Flavobacteriales bacterium]|nr:1,4-dihydroxy-2-naphthoate polyprenyltransferase [Flavobacteriales bacterium]
MKPWLQAFRLRTLPLAVSSILVGSALASVFQKNRSDYHFSVTTLLLALLTAVLLQILSNLANDLGDHEHGTDNADRVGPQRAVQSGAISPGAMKRAMIICALLALTSGIALITVSLGLRLMTLAFLLLGVAAIAAAIKYTFGKNPYGYAGLGDVSVFLFFGIIGVCGTYYLHARQLSPSVILPAVAFGLLSAGVLNVNNMRDITNDAASGKRTLVVRMGSANARIYHTVLVLGGVLCLVAFTGLLDPHWTQWLFLITAPLFVLHLRTVLTNTEPRLLDPELKRLALGTFFTAILFSLGCILAA